MADFRKWLFALAVVALLAGLTVPASAQSIFSPTTSLLPLLLPQNPGGTQATDKSPPTPTCTANDDPVVTCPEAQTVRGPITQAEIEQNRKTMTPREHLAWLKKNNLLSCNILFPYVTQAPGYDTGIAIANTSPDDIPSEPSPVKFWYYDQSDKYLGSETSGTVASGQVLRYDLTAGSKYWKISPKEGFTGYMIAQASWAACQGYAFVGNQNESRLSEGYLALVLDKTPVSYPLKE